jgi:YHS domain-containing protein
MVLLLRCAGAAAQPAPHPAPEPLPPISMSNTDAGKGDDSAGLALMGDDPVARFPQGVHAPVLGSVVRGAPSRYAAKFQGARFAFANQADLSAFLANPRRFIPDVGGYCLRAMSQRHITPGDPRNAVFVREEPNGGMWAIFGRPVGAREWQGMTPQQRRRALATAHAWYRQRTQR